MQTNCVPLCKNSNVAESKVSKVQQATKIKQLLQDIESNQSAKISTALDGLQLVGDERVIAPLVDVLRKLSAENQALVVEFLSSLKHTPSKAEIMKAVLDDTNGDVLTILLSTIWNSPLDYSEYIGEFVRLAVQRDFMVTLECLTILENLEGPFEESHILECQLQLRDYLEGAHEKSSQKNHLISEIALLVKDIDRNLQD